MELESNNWKDQLHSSDNTNLCSVLVLPVLPIRDSGSAIFSNPKPRSLACGFGEVVMIGEERAAYAAALPCFAGTPRYG
ncbi:hypothetical protein [Acidocella sp.]|uniref:hypothetical protein n=1 Tax=Acidocella sp. TaxID=50710 RepID=UPI003D04260F